MVSEVGGKQPPVAEKIPVERLHHGNSFIDDYEWLRDKDDPQVLAHLAAENQYTDEQTEHLDLLCEQIFEEIKGRTKETDLSVPVREGSWWYFTRTLEGKQYGIHCRAPISEDDEWEPPELEHDDVITDDDGLVLCAVQIGAGELDGTVHEKSVEELPGEEVLLDDNVEAEGHEFYALGSLDVSSDGTRMLYAVDTVGDERYTVRIRDLATGENLPDEIPNTSAGALFDPSGRFVFYTTVDDAWRPDTVWRHEVGSPAGADVQIFREPDEKYWVGIGLTRSRKYLLIDLESKITSETHILDADDPTGEFRVVWPRREGVEYSVEHAVLGGEDRLLIVHNDGAMDFELVDVPADAPQSDGRVLVPHRRGVRIEGVDAFAGQLVLEYRREALTRIAVATLDDGAVAGEPEEDGGFDPTTELDWVELEFEESLFSVGVGGNPEWTQPVVRMHYTSFVTPTTVFDYDVATGDRSVLKRQPVLGGYNPDMFEQRREWATAEDGTRVPISLVYRKDWVEPGRPSPLLLYGYGSYEHSIDPGFSIPRISLLDRGMIFAVAHVRGGGELGRAWYEEGKKLHKRNTFTDFVACANHLLENDWTSPDRLVAEGGSAGGLLMGAVANLAPRDFAGIMAQVPFVDPLTSILDPSLPLTVVEWDEWGNPLEDPEVYAYMRSYSPYENVHAAGYPKILAITSLNDTRVLYVEPAKWVAKLREVGAPVLLQVEMSAGHGGVSGRYRAWRKRAFEYAWILDAAGMHLHLAD
jgi:oligopeptidase B